MQYQGFLKTPFLWRSNRINNLQQFDLQITYSTSFNLKIEGNPRLEKLVERFVSNQLEQDKAIKILAENIQVQDHKITLGELDCLLLKNGIPIHLEIIYKFYLYDPKAGNSEIEHWIGPNRRDSFVQKINKLKEKQLPLLYHSLTKPILNQLKLSVKDIKQQVYFKAQLFVPLKDFGKEFDLINNDCIKGFYITVKELNQFSDCKFYIPTKHNWLVEPHVSIDWLSLENFTSKLTPFIENESSPLCWLKKPNGELIKFFVVWW
ncbi:hypothetical protein C7447_102219 [Tenacibaculum adriaticum]|uniref:DUF1853 family protein n=1 Tax=Tenacibaculum adriaticum TaxID=413713 RepID=A0A5S5DSN3_9FLAO|nr:DUF1853 family protein [Tenacibaculum adriaticum]TYP98901.1 hypothetical protein C7447_102219 [Tenacibaculum adriaticum]